MVTPALFARFPRRRPRQRRSSDRTLAKSTGFFAQQGHPREVRSPSNLAAKSRTLDELTTGVARKTANVVLGGVPTAERIGRHVGRVPGWPQPARRSGRRQDLVPFAPTSWADMGIKSCGRYVCLNMPRCAECPINESCASRKHEALAAGNPRGAEGLRVAARDTASRGDTATPP
jgi:hypothetical protein